MSIASSDQANPALADPSALPSPSSPPQSVPATPWIKTPAAYPLIFLTLFFVVLLLRTSWVCDDAYITFRVMDNFVHGYGLRFNVDERVWTQTNTLWMFLLTPVYLLTGEIFYTSMFFCVLVSAAVFLLVTAGGRSLSRALFAGVLLISSRAFVDFSSSGLENPLSHLLYALFILLLLRYRGTGRQAAASALLAGLSILNRPDSALFFIPAMLWIFFTTPKLRLIKAWALGFIPLIAWEIFAVIYYGFPFPNTAYAKLSGEIPAGLRLQQGFFYFMNSLDWDPVTLAAIGAAGVYALVSRQARLAALGAGIALYLAFVFYIGGDFMSGRFFSIAFVGAVMILRHGPRRETPLADFALAACVLTLAVVTPTSPFHILKWLRSPDRVEVDHRAIADERSCYYPGCLLAQVTQDQVYPVYEWAKEGRDLRVLSQQQKIMLVKFGIGFVGYFAGPRVHIIDRLALSDVFLARMPASETAKFRPGHIPRVIPELYAESLQGGVCRLTYPPEAELYNAVQAIVRGPLFSGRRLTEIFRMNTGYYDRLIKDIRLRHQLGTKIRPYEKISKPLPEGARWDDAQATVLNKEGIFVTLPKPVKSRTLEATLDNDDIYKFVFMNGGRRLAETDVKVPLLKSGGLKLVTIPVPEPAVNQGYDTIGVIPVNGDGSYSVGHVRTLD